MRKNIKECGKILLTDSTLEAIIPTNDPTTSRTILYDDVRVPFGKVLCDNGEREREGHFGSKYCSNIQLFSDITAHSLSRSFLSSRKGMCA